MVFKEKGYSEAPYARAMAEAVGAEHYERVITAQDVLNELGDIVRTIYRLLFRACLAGRN